MPKKPETAVAVLKHVLDQFNRNQKTRPFLKKIWNKCSNDGSLMLELGKSRASKKQSKIDITVDKILVKYNSLRHFARESGMPWNHFHRQTYIGKGAVCKRKFVKKFTDREIKHIREHFAEDDISFPMPEAKFIGKRFMRGSMKKCHKMYNELKTTTRKIGLSTYYKYKPKTVKLQGKIPFRQSCCERCENFTNLMKEGNRYMSGIVCDLSSIVDASLCPYEGHFPNKSCVLRICDKCGVDNFRDHVIESNPQKIKDTRKRFLVKQWINKTKILPNGNRQTYLHWTFLRLSYAELLEKMCEQLEAMSVHTFMASWNYNQYKKAKQNLKPGVIIMVHDFAQNYLSIHQNEPQGLHWVHAQATLMPTVVHYICPNDNCGSLVTREIGHMSEDLTHDAHLVKQMRNRTIEVLKENGIDIRKIIEFTDQAPNQYKNKTNFHYVSQSDIPMMCNFFGVRHGKGPCDACTGRIKQAVVNLVKTGEVVVNSPETFFEVCDKHLTKSPEPGKCKHHLMTFEYHKKIKKRPVTTKWNGIPDTRRIHSVCNSGTMRVMNFKYFACCCEGCVYGNGPCSNTICPEPWKGHDMLKNKTNPAVMTQWHTTGRQITWAERIQKLSEFTNFVQLQNYIRKNPLPEFVCCPDITMTETDQLRLDLIALHHVPADAPTGYAPVSVGSDGNCFPRTISYILFKSEDRYMEIRVRIVYEAVLNKNKYLDDTYISHGATNFYRRATLVEQFAQYSDNFVPGRGFNVNTLYNKEVLDICKDMAFMGIWQIFQTANVIQNPIKSVYPSESNPNVRADINRIVNCHTEQFNNKVPICLMWTPMQIKNTRPIHFVPLLKVVIEMQTLSCKYS